MLDSTSTLRPLGQEHFDAYYEVVTKLLSRANGTIAKAALGTEMLELLNRQMGAMNTLKAGYELNFDVRHEAKELHGFFMYNFGILEKRNIAYQEKMKEPLERFHQLLKEEHYLGWLTDAGRAVVMKPLMLRAPLQREMACIPIRGYAMRGAIITAGEAIRDASASAFEYAFKSLFEAFIGYYLDGVYLRKQLGPDFEKNLAEMFEVYDTIDARIAAIKAKAEQEAQEKAQAEADARRWSEEEDEHTSVNVRGAPADTYVPFADDDDDRYRGPSFNPANGLPMDSSGCWDVMGNAYGTDFNHM